MIRVETQIAPESVSPRVVFLDPRKCMLIDIWSDPITWTEHPVSKQSGVEESWMIRLVSENGIIEFRVGRDEHDKFLKQLEGVK